MKPLLLVAAPVTAFLAFVVGVLVILTPGGDTASAVAACIPGGTASTDLDLDQEQLGVAAAVIKVGKQLDVPPRGWVVALATGLQESGLRPLPYGDRDSIGVFQQRAAWGPYDERIDPHASAWMFFTGGQAGQPGLLDIDGWSTQPVTVAAQAVQVSAYPDAYAKWESLAVRLVKRLASVDATCAQTDQWVFPLGDAPYVETAGFGDCGGGHWSACHTGQDYAAPTGTPVLAVGGGEVTAAGWDGAYGNSVRILHTGGVVTTYSHLSRIQVTPGGRATPGQVIGLVGSTGNSTGPHLHFEVRTGASGTSSGTPIDPSRWLESHRAK